MFVVCDLMSVANECRMSADIKSMLLGHLEREHQTGFQTEPQLDQAASLMRREEEQKTREHEEPSLLRKAIRWSSRKLVLFFPKCSLTFREQQTLVKED